MKTRKCYEDYNKSYEAYNAAFNAGAATLVLTGIGASLPVFILENVAKSLDAYAFGKLYWYSFFCGLLFAFFRLCFLFVQGFDAPPPSTAFSPFTKTSYNSLGTSSPSIAKSLLFLLRDGLCSIAITSFIFFLFWIAIPNFRSYQLDAEHITLMMPVIFIIGVTISCIICLENVQKQAIISLENVPDAYNAHVKWHEQLPPKTALKLAIEQIKNLRSISSELTKNNSQMGSVLAEMRSLLNIRKERTKKLRQIRTIRFKRGHPWRKIKCVSPVLTSSRVSIKSPPPLTPSSKLSMRDINFEEVI